MVIPGVGDGAWPLDSSIGEVEVGPAPGMILPLNDDGPHTSGGHRHGAEEGIRTPDLLITSELLYP